MELLAKVGVATYISTKENPFWPMCAFLFVAFNGCFIG